MERHSFRIVSGELHFRHFTQCNLFGHKGLYGHNDYVSLFYFALSCLMQFQAISKVVEGFALPLFNIILNICYMRLSILRNPYNLQLYFSILETETLSALKFYCLTCINNGIYVQINFLFFKLYLLQAEVTAYIKLVFLSQAKVTRKKPTWLIQI